MGKGNGAEGVGKSVYLFRIDEESGTANLVRMPFETPNAEGAILVRTSEDVVRGITKATLEQYPEDVQDALAKLVKQSVRSRVRGADAFVPTEIELKLPATISKGKGKKAVEEVLEDDEDEEEVTTTFSEPTPQTSQW